MIGSPTQDVPWRKVVISLSSGCWYLMCDSLTSLTWRETSMPSRARHSATLSASFPTAFSSGWDSPWLGTLSWAPSSRVLEVKYGILAHFRSNRKRRRQARRCQIWSFSRSSRRGPLVYISDWKKCVFASSHSREAAATVRVAGLQGGKNLMLVCLHFCGAGGTGGAAVPHGVCGALSARTRGPSCRSHVQLQNTLLPTLPF